MSRRTYIVKDKQSNDWWALILAAALVAYGKDLLILGISMAIAYLVFQYLEYRVNLKKDKARADAEETVHRYYDPLYGKYEPYTMPLTYPIDTTFPYKMRGPK